MQTHSHVQSTYVNQFSPPLLKIRSCYFQPCLDTPNWNDGVHGCDWYQEMDAPGCPKYGELFGEKVMGFAKDHCCYCKRKVLDLVTVSGKMTFSMHSTTIDDNTNHTELFASAPTLWYMTAIAASFNLHFAFTFIITCLFIMH